MANSRLRDVAPPEREIATTRAASRAWWFLGTLAVLRNPKGAPRTPAIIELTVPPGGSPPAHFHRDLDDSFLLLEGELVVRCGDKTFLARPGDYVSVPAGMTHTFRVTSRSPARMLLVHDDASFLEMVEAVGTPTEELELPPAGPVDLDLDLDALVRVNAEYDTFIVGASLEAGEADTYTAPRSESPDLGALHHLAIAASDLGRSADWYEQAFGLARIDGEIAPDGSGQVTLASPGGWIVALQRAEVAKVGHAAIACRGRDALLAWHALLASRSVEPGTVTDAPYGSGFVVRDPDGIEIELFAPTPTH